MDRMWVWGVTVHPRGGQPRLLAEHWISVEDEMVRVWPAPDAEAPVAEAPLSYATIHWSQPPETAGSGG
jgi:hypothetical protein